jgi:hypothetical protein
LDGVRLDLRVGELVGSWELARRVGVCRLAAMGLRCESGLLVGLGFLEAVVGGGTGDPDPR